MNWTRPLGGLAALGIALAAVGAVVVLVGQTLLAGDRVIAAAVVVALVVLSVGGTAAVGTRGGGEWLENPGYW